MKRDLNLVREILLWAIEQDECEFSKNPEIEGYSSEQVSYHIYLMDQAGLVVARNFRENFAHISNKYTEADLITVTWAGHDFADAAKDNNLWNKAKKFVIREGASITFDYLKDWLRQNIPPVPPDLPIS